MVSSKQKHSMQPQPNHDESVRQDFVTDLRAFLTDEIYPKITPYYEKNVETKLLFCNIYLYISCSHAAIL